MKCHPKSLVGASTVFTLLILIQSHEREAIQAGALATILQIRKLGKGHTTSQYGLWGNLTAKSSLLLVLASSIRSFWGHDFELL